MQWCQENQVARQKVDTWQSLSNSNNSQLTVHTTSSIDAASYLKPLTSLHVMKSPCKRKVINTGNRNEAAQSSLLLCSGLAMMHLVSFFFFQPREPTYLGYLARSCACCMKPAL